MYTLSSVWTDATGSVEAECHHGPISCELEATIHQYHWFVHLCHWIWLEVAHIPLLICLNCTHCHFCCVLKTSNSKLAKSRWNSTIQANAFSQITNIYHGFTVVTPIISMVLWHKCGIFIISNCIIYLSFTYRPTVFMQSRADDSKPSGFMDGRMCTRLLFNIRVTSGSLR